MNDLQGRRLWQETYCHSKVIKRGNSLSFLGERQEMATCLPRGLRRWVQSTELQLLYDRRWCLSLLPHSSAGGNYSRCHNTTPFPKVVVPQHVRKHCSKVWILNNRPVLYQADTGTTDNLSEKPVQRFSSSVQGANSSLNPSFTMNATVAVPLLTFFTVVSSKFWGADAEVIVVSYFADSTVVTGICTTWI